MASRGEPSSEIGSDHPPLKDIPLKGASIFNLQLLTAWHFFVIFGNKDETTMLSASLIILDYKSRDPVI